MSADIDELNLREYILNAGYTIAPIEVPGWPQAEGKLAVREFSGEESMRFQQDSDNPKTLGELLAAVLLNRATGQPIFKVTDRDFVIRLGASKLLPIMLKAAELSNIGADAVEQAKKNLQSSQASASSSN